ncbi:MAG: S8 family serine peptidase [Saprospiraceae bacterium]|nr:S8 family serine peptidase [Saprospiraceae bacterium]
MLNNVAINGRKIVAEILDYYPEASVYVYQLSISSKTERDIIKEKIEGLLHRNIEFVGSVFKRSDNGVYQIYTGNLFLKFRRGTTHKHIEIFFHKYGLIKKSELKFAVNSFFVEFENPIGRSIFEKSVEILQEDIVEICQPELVVNRKVFNAEVMPDVELLYDEWAAKMIRLKEAWSFTKGRGVKICIIDDGIELSHPSFINEHRSILTKDMFFDDETPATHKDESEKHGTACASIAAGNDSKILGVAPEADLLIVRSKGLGSVYEAEAIYWAVRNKADIISCSWGPADGNLLTQEDDFIFHPLPDHTRLALEYAVSHGRGGKGCLIFFAAGNGREPIEYDGYAANSNVMAIGAVNKSGKRSYYSDHGRELFCCFPSSEVIVENHRNILTIYGLPTLDRLAELGYSSDDYFSSFGGTSASSPGMAGVAALMLSINGSLNLNQCKQLMQESCYYPDSIDKEVKPKELGHGIIDAHVLVQKAQNYSNSLNKFPMTTQNKRLAIHVAVDVLNQSIYKGDYPTLYGCKKDLTLFKSLTEDKYEQIIFEDKNAIRSNVLSALEKAVERLRDGDELVFTFSGHGGTYNDNGSDEIDGKDECLVLHDGLWMDDEIYDLHQRFADGVKIFWYTDSCHSGTSTRGIGLERSLRTKRANTQFRAMKPIKYRQIEHSVLKNVYEQNKRSMIGY